LGIPIGLPTLGGRIIVAVAAWNGRVDSGMFGKDGHEAGMSSKGARALVGMSPHSGHHHQHHSPFAEAVGSFENAAIVASPAAQVKAERQGFESSGNLRHRGRGKRRDRSEESESSSSTDVSKGKRGRDRVRDQDFSHWKLRTDHTLEKCSKSCEDLDHKMSANAGALQGLDMYAKSLGGEIRRLNVMLEAHGTHRKTLESRMTSVEQRGASGIEQSPSHVDVHMQRMRSDFEGALNEQMGGIRRQCDQFAQQLQEVSRAVQAVGLIKAEAGVKNFQHQLVEAIALPQPQLKDAHKLALRLLRQASEVAAILCTEHLDSDSRELRKLRAKYQSARELRELVRTAIYEKVRDVLEAPGRHGAEVVHKALMDTTPDEAFAGMDATLGSPERGPVLRKLFEDSYRPHPAHPRGAGGPPMQGMGSPQIVPVQTIPSTMYHLPQTMSSPQGAYFGMRPRMPAPPQGPVPFPAIIDGSPRPVPFPAIIDGNPMSPPTQTQRVMSPGRERREHSC
jgi:hypothetical protein